MKNALLRFAIAVFSMCAFTSCGEVDNTSLSIIDVEEEEIQTGPIILVDYGYLSSRIVIEDGCVYLPIPDKDGCEFIGWYYDEEFTHEFDPYATVQENTKLYAKFMERTFIDIKSKDDFFQMKEDGNYRLTCNIDFGGDAITPIGTYAKPYTGEFDGSNYTISNFSINSDEFYSPFGVISGKVINLKVKNNITVDTSKSLLVAGVVSVNQKGLVKNCSSSGRMVISGSSSASTIYAAGVVARNDRGTVRLCGSEMSISNYNEGTAISGGVVAYNGGGVSFKTSYVENCIGRSSNITSVSNNLRCASYAGGVVGYNFGSVDKCISYSQSLVAQCSEYQCFAAGVVADNNGGRLTNLFSASDVGVITEKGNTFRGSVVARNFEATTEDLNGTYENIYGFVGQHITYEIPSKYESITNNYQLAAPLLSVETLSKKESLSNKLKLKEFNFKDGSYPSYNNEYKAVATNIEEGLPGNPISIKTKEDLQNIEYNKSYRLDADISLTGFEITPIGTYTRPYSGVFEGNGHKITNFTITTANSGYNALFGCINGTVQNLQIEGSVDYKTSAKVSQFNGIISAMAIRSYFENCNVKLNFDVECFGSNLGGVAGYAEYSNFYRCSSEGTIQNYANDKTNYSGGIAGLGFGCELNECSSKTTINSNGKLLACSGGLLGKLQYGAVRNCIADSTFNIYDPATLYVGGLVGMVGKGKIEKSFANLSVDTSSYGLIGGICGNNQEHINNCVYSAQTDIYSCGSSSTIVDTKKASELDKSQTLKYLGKSFAYDGDILCLAYTLEGK